MSKNKRKRRLKEEDFKKKKLKVGKKLPMPDNVTRTSFKARSINISQQNLKQDDGQNESNFKGQKLKDLLNSCSHYNIQAREQALLGLKELFEKHPGILSDNLNAVLQRLLSLITDLESSVRKTFLMLISLIFKTLSETEISPFFANIVAYLCSAMTHLNESIRLDSMQFLDLCLECFPQLVKANPKNIIVNFMNVISVEKSGVGKSGGIPIKTQLNAKVTSQKTQLEVLRRLNRLLCIVLGNGSMVTNDSVEIDDSIMVSCHYYGNDLQSTSLHDGSNLGVTNFTNTKDTRPSAFYNPNPTLISNFSLKKCPSEFQTSTTDEKWLAELFSSLAPVLFEYWVECCPAEFAMNLIPVRKASIPLQIMKEILEIFVSLVKSLEKNILYQSRFQEFLERELFSQFNAHFMKVFPLSFTFQQSGRKSKIESIESITDVKLNILIAQLLSFNISVIEPMDDLPKWSSRVLAYLQEVLASRSTSKQTSRLSVDDIKSLTQLVKIFLLNLPKAFENEKVGLLESMFQLYESSRVTSATKSVLLEFLAEIIDGERNRIGGAMKTILDEWLESLLRILKEIGLDLKHKIFAVCNSGILQQFPKITNAMVKALPSIFNVENFSKLSEQVQQLVMEILYHTRKVPSRELFEVLAKLCTSNCISFRVCKYLLFVVHQLVHRMPTTYLVSCLSDYLSFMLSVGIGHTQKELEKLQSLGKGQSNCYNYEEINKLYTIVAQFENNKGNPQITNESWEHTNKMIKIICKFLAQSDYSAEVFNMLKVPLCTLFKKYQTLPLGVVYRLLHLVKTLLCLSKEEADCDELLTFISTWCAIIWCFLLKMSTEFGKVLFIDTIINHLKAVTNELCKSEIIFENMLGSFVPSTMPNSDPQLTCQVVTDVLKEMQGSLTKVHLSTLKDLYQNLERASNKGVLNSQVFSDFKYRYQSCVKRFMVCDQL